jgi:hypothetical protein
MDKRGSLLPKPEAWSQMLYEQLVESTKRKENLL